MSCPPVDAMEWLLPDMVTPAGGHVAGAVNIRDGPGRLPKGASAIRPGPLGAADPPAGPETGYFASVSFTVSRTSPASTVAT